MVAFPVFAVCSSANTIFAEAKYFVRSSEKLGYSSEPKAYTGVLRHRPNSESIVLV